MRNLKNAFANGFTKIVDKLGGVYMDIDHRYLNDNSSGGETYVLHLQTANQLVKGNQVRVGGLAVGEITDIALKGNQVDALILSVGGFLGMGEHYVAVSPSSVSVKRDTKNDKWVATMNTTKEALKAAPEFKYPK